MKINCLVFSLFIIFTPAPAQNIPSVLYNETVIGKNNTLNTDIYAREFIFDGTILHSYVDSVSKLLTMELTDENDMLSGEVVVYDMQSREMAWTKPVNYALGGIEWFSEFVLYRQLNWNYALDGKTGNELWKIKNDIYIYDRLNMIAMGYRAGTGINRLQGVNLEDGTVLWERKLDRTHGWNSMHRLNDSVLLIAASGLHTVNVKTGEGWDYDAVTWRQSYNPSGRGSYITLNDVVSNVLIDSTEILFACRDKLVMLDYEGNVLWEHPLPEHLTSRSTLIKRSGYLYLINGGYCKYEYSDVKCGQPFIASFDLKIRQQIYFRNQEDDDEPVKNFAIVSRNILLMHEDKVSKHSLVTGRPVEEKTFDTQLTGTLQFFYKNVFVKEDYGFISLMTMPEHYLMNTSNGQVLVVDENMEVLYQIDVDKVYTTIYEKWGYDIVTNGNDKVYVLDREGRQVAELNLSGRITLLDSRLYDFRDNKFYEIDFENVIAGNEFQALSY